MFHPLGAVRDRWILMLLVAWFGFALWMLAERWGAIQWFALGDTDDNLRIAQVRAWLGGQGWFDLRQYRLNPPEGFDIHWSRLVDLPIAGLIVMLKPLLGGRIAEQVAVAAAPLLPLGLTLIALGLAARRLLSPSAYLLSVAALLLAQPVLAMFMPLRIDHHGWQLALLAVTIAGLADPARVRGGIVVGIASALSLAIGLELLPYIAVAGATIGLRWVVHQQAAPRLAAYAASFGLATGAAFLLFASEANRAPRCDALTPVWLSTILVGTALLALLARLPLQRWPVRLGLALGAAALVGLFYWFAWPACRGRPEGVSPELYRLWLANVREAKPLHVQDWPVIIGIIALPLLGLLGALLGLWRDRGNERLYPWLSLVVMSLFSVGMLFWQVRAGPAAQVIAVTGAAALGWLLIRFFAARRSPIARVFGITGAVLLVAGAPLLASLPIVPKPKRSANLAAISRANRLCPTLPALAPIAKLPPATILTFVDLGPRLVAVTPHRAIAGPYHRNEAAILDVHRAFDGSPDQARRIARRHGATLLLICPNLSESTVYRTRSPNGFYARLARGERFDWLAPLPLPPGSPYRLWRIS